MFLTRCYFDTNNRFCASLKLTLSAIVTAELWEALAGSVILADPPGRAVPWARRGPCQGVVAPSAPSSLLAHHHSHRPGLSVVVQDANVPLTPGEFLGLVITIHNSPIHD